MQHESTTSNGAGPAPTSVPAAKPVLEIIPEKAFVRSDGVTRLNVLVRIIPPPIAEAGKRPPLNLGLVIDRSGSMGGDKLKHACEAASYVVRQLIRNDRVSVTIFDDRVETIVPSVLAHGRRTSIANRIGQVDAGGSTALHDGWVEGGVQVGTDLEAGRLSRVLLLTDGQANVGKVDPADICKDVRGLAQRGVSTTTLGVGLDYNEDLLEAMARSGDGNYYFIESSTQLPAIFAAELQGLCATMGRTVSLGVEPQGGADLIDVPSDLDRNSYGRLLLPNLISGSPVEVLLTLRVPPRTVEADVSMFRLAWEPTQTPGRRVIREALALPAVTSAEWDLAPSDPRVTEQLDQMKVNRMRQQALQSIDSGDLVEAQRYLGHAMLCVDSAEPSASMVTEANEIAELRQRLEHGDLAGAAKQGKYRAYNVRRGR